jgi:AcrR family transcriptional regulator
MPKTAQTRANGNKTKQLILDAAEQLIGDRGFDAVSLRDITEQAGVTLALASYHFGTKQNLFESVVARRASVLCELREANLAALPEDADVQAVLDAFMSPLFQQVQTGDAGWVSYMQVLSRLTDGDRWLYLLAEHFDATARTFMDRLYKILPTVERSALARAFTMSLQLMLVTVAKHRRLDSLTDNDVQAGDLAAAYAPLLKFTTAGVTTLRP